MTRGRLVTFAALVAALAWALMTVGAYVRVSDSGLGCPDWPACHGQLVAGGHHALIEQVHRWIVTVLSGALVVLAALVYRLRRGERRVTTAMTITLALLALQVVLGGVTVLLNNVSWTVVMHYGAAAALLAAVLLVVVRLAFPEADSPPRDAYVRLVTWLAGAGVKRGLVYGASDPIGGYPAANPVSPEDMAATIYTLLGIDPHQRLYDSLNRPHTITEGTPVHELLV